MHKPIFFDLGWTLENEMVSQVDRAEKVVAFCKEIGITTSIDNVLQGQDEAGKNGVSNVFKYALTFIGVPENQISIVLKKANWNPEYLELYEDAIKCLELLFKENALGIIANQSKPVDNRLKAYGIYKYFKPIISSCDVGCEKPDLEIFRLALKQSTNLFSENWMIGDRIDNDIIPAKKMGWKTIRVLQGNHRQQEPKTDIEKADYTVNKLSEIPEILKQRIV